MDSGNTMDAGVGMWHGWTGLEKSMGRIWRLGGDYRRRERRAAGQITHTY